MPPVRVILTYKDYEALPNNGRIYEIHEGELWITPPPTPDHQFTTSDLFRPLDTHVRTQELGEVLFAPIDVILSDITIVQPDLVFIEKARLSQISSRGIEGPPTLVVQVLSPSTAQVNRTAHFQLFAKHGVPHYWIVDPQARVIEAYVLRQGSYELAVRASGPHPACLPPFPQLQLSPTPSGTNGPSRPSNDVMTSCDIAGSPLPRVTASVAQAR
jgi:Uma2 family endonuclease